MQAGIPYTADTGEKLVNETFGPNNIHRKTSGTQQFQTMEVRDGAAAATRWMKTASPSSNTGRRCATSSTQKS